MESQRAKARALEAEITALRRACIETQAPGDDDSQVRKSFQETYQSDSEEWRSSKDLRSHLESLESELQFLSGLTGISIRNYCKKTEDLTSTEMAEKSIKKVLQRHRLSGNCHMIMFQLEFQILEIQDKESLSSVITDLSIIMEPTEYSELSQFVSRAEEKRDLLMFFRSLRCFVEWCDYRKRTFKHFKAPLVMKNPSANAGEVRHTGLIPGLGRSPGGGHTNPLQYSCVENLVDRGAWQATVHGVAKSWTRLSNFTSLNLHSPTLVTSILHPPIA
ncbi:centromere protein P isoform 2-T2 [Dama dama]